VTTLRRTARLQAQAPSAQNKRLHRGRSHARGTGAAVDGDEGVGGLHQSVEVGEPRGSGTRRSKGGPCWDELQEGTMTVAPTTESMSPGLLKVTERARRDPNAQFNSLAHLIDPAALERAYRRLRKDAAIGVDGITKEQYGQSLGGNLAARRPTRRSRTRETFRRTMRPRPGEAPSGAPVDESVRVRGRPVGPP
jgi:hypothetical protein